MIQQAKDLSPEFADKLAQLKEIAESVWFNRDVMVNVALTQAVLESGLTNGISGLALHNNLFGIKGSGTNGISRMGTHEVINGREITVRDGFAVNKTLRDSFEQHRNLLSKPRYEDVLHASSEDEAFEQLYECGYATDPKYSDKLKKIFKQHIERLQ